MKEKMYWLKKHTYLNSLVIKVLPGHLVITVTTTIERIELCEPFIELYFELGLS